MNDEDVGVDNPEAKVLVISEQDARSLLIFKLLQDEGVSLDSLAGAIEAVCVEALMEVEEQEGVMYEVDVVKEYTPNLEETDKRVQYRDWKLFETFQKS